MLRKLALAALPAIIRRYDSGVGIRVLGTMYGCDPNWLRDQILKAGHRVRPLKESTSMRPTAPLPWTPIRLPGRKAMP
ncbi:hypothetical protein PUR61_21240 [Streptomyces sp. BE20]|uniref:hypothetical protein n=1 Tax=Streptomyces sp. BE20 TaxID=3002525 RepID=UPI002E7A25AE|nr:hypothetical protein [Streptomyces sp. BE20]MEE1824684.1 hypothetical protein [Streptomyces sp. BE20]